MQLQLKGLVQYLPFRPVQNQDSATMNDAKKDQSDVGEN